MHTYEYPIHQPLIMPFVTVHRITHTELHLQLILTDQGIGHGQAPKCLHLNTKAEWMPFLITGGIVLSIR